MIAVKQNQPRLYAQMQTNIEASDPLSIDYTLEKNGARIEERAVFVYDTLDGIDPDWQGLERLIAVERTRYKGKTVSEETAYYISSLEIEASEFNRGIRGHWHIENSLHWVKDVVFKEDASKIRSGNAPENLSLIKNWAMSVFRKNGHRSMAKAVRLLANDLELSIQYLE